MARRRVAAANLSPEKAAEAQELAKRIQALVEEDIQELARLLVSKKESEIFGDTEFQVRDIVHRMGTHAYETYLAEKKNGYQGSSVTCPQCDQAAKFQCYAPKKPISLLGEIQCQRAYYYCGRCGKGIFPWDEAVGLTPKRLTPAAERAVSLAGILSDSFEEAAEKTLPELSGLHLAETNVERTSEAAGDRLGQLLEQGRTLDFPKPWSWHRDAQGRTCAYVSIDATGVRQQAADGGKAEGRMPYVAMVYNPVPELPDDSPYQPPAHAHMQARYLAGLYDLDELGLQLRRQAGQVGMNHAQVWIGLTDGGNGLENFVRKNFPRDPVLILDYWHAAEDLRELAKLIHPRDEEKAKQLSSEWCHVLKHEGGRATIAVLEKLVLPRSPAARVKRDEVLQYFRNNVHRMDYPSYRAQGWLIGSGAVESACKTVVGQRLKQAGMRWREYGTDNVCHLRALFKSEPGQWRSFWQRSIN